MLNKYIQVFIQVTILTLLRSDVVSATNIDDAFHGIATVAISTYSKGQSVGTAFYYNRFIPYDPNIDKLNTHRVQSTWLVTNRHVLIPKDNNIEIFPDSFIFHLRHVNTNNTISWEPVIIKGEDLRKRAKFHIDNTVDVCAIEIMDLIKHKFVDGGRYMNWSYVSISDLPRNVETADDIVVIGFPRIFYDKVNLFPIVKQGIIASRWGAHFNGQPYFLIDAKLFPGSSGSIVVSKPKNIWMENGNIKARSSGEKVFHFLGIYSGEPIPIRKTLELDGITISADIGINLGIVWYGKLVEDIINNGVAYSNLK